MLPRKLVYFFSVILGFFWGLHYSIGLPNFFALKAGVDGVQSNAAASRAETELQPAEDKQKVRAENGLLLTRERGTCVTVEEGLREYFAYVKPLMEETVEAGKYDSLTVAAHLCPLLADEAVDRRGPLILDIGANTGDTSAVFVSLFGARIRLIAYEPHPENFKALKQRGVVNGWGSKSSFQVFPVAFTSASMIQASGGDPEEGFAKVKFYSVVTDMLTRKIGDQQGSLLPQDNTVVTYVDSFTLDAHLFALEEEGASIFLLKIDTEGLDGQVLIGAQRTLGRVRLLVFEYNSKWRPTGDTLEGTLLWLKENFRFICYWILEDHLVPVSGKFWTPAYEFFTWSNLFCHKNGDEAAENIVVAYNFASATVLPVVCK